MSSEKNSNHTICSILNEMLVRFKASVKLVSNAADIQIGQELEQIPQQISMEDIDYATNLWIDISEFIYEWQQGVLIQLGVERDIVIKESTRVRFKELLELCAEHLVIANRRSFISKETTDIGCSTTASICDFTLKPLKLPAQLLTFSAPSSFFPPHDLLKKSNSNSNYFTSSFSFSALVKPSFLWSNPVPSYPTVCLGLTR